MLKYAHVQEWVDQMAALSRPEEVYWCDGSEEERLRLTAQAVKTGELIELDQQRFPRCYLHRTATNDVARTEQLTYICTSFQGDAGPTNNWMSPREAYRKAQDIFSGSMVGRTMYVVPFAMGPIGSPFSKIGIEVTDSIYVVLNMRIMARMGEPVLDALGPQGEFTRCLHSKADLNVDRRMILHFPEDNAIWSVGSGYGGNVLLGKKCLALRIASVLAQREKWLAEHMLILGIEEPNGRIQYVAAAFPSACGKTNLAMLLPPEGLKQKGYRIWTVGDDIAWMRVDTDGQLWAVNPEMGFFGVVPGTNSRSNRNALLTISRDTIYTNVALRPDRTVWWEGHDEPAPAEAIDWQGRPWHAGLKDAQGKPVPSSHANSRFTAPFTNCPTHSFRFDQHHGVPIAAIIFGGRRATLAPLVYEALNWEHGIYLGATMASERTAAQVGALGEVRRDPMAMLPFCGYNMADYFGHWFDMGTRIRFQPRIFHVNWFRTDDQGKFLWPGYGENLRIIEWILARCREEVPGISTPIGYVPDPTDIDMTGLELPPGAMQKLLAVNKQDWQAEWEAVGEFFNQFGRRLPDQLWEQHEALRHRLEVAKTR